MRVECNFYWLVTYPSHLVHCLINSNMQKYFGVNGLETVGIWVKASRGGPEKWDGFVGLVVSIS